MPKKKEYKFKIDYVVIIVMVLCILLLSLFMYSQGYASGENKGFTTGYLESCKYKIPDGCKTCTTDEAIKEFCFTSKQPYMCNLAKEYQSRGIEAQTVIYNENWTGGVKLR